MNKEVHMNKTFTTEKGIAYYPYISAPDTKFDEQGHYKVNLCLSQEKAKPVIEMINNEILSGIKALKADKPNTNIKQAPLPYADETDEDGNPTGNVIIKFKSKAAYKPAVFDSKGTMMPNSNIYGGSEIKVSGSISFYHTGSIGAGVSLRLRAVQLIQYVEGAVGATKFGFTEEEGFTLEDPDTNVTDTSNAIEENIIPATSNVKPIKPVTKLNPAAAAPKAETPQEVETPKAGVAGAGAGLADEIAQLINDTDADDA